MPTIAINPSQALTEYAFELISHTNVLLEISALAVAKAAREVLLVDLKVTLTNFANLGVNQHQVSGYAIRNAQESLEDHMRQETITNQIRYIRSNFLTYMYCKYWAVNHLEIGAEVQKLRHPGYIS